VFETGITLTPRVDRHGRISVRQTYYSVPARFIGARVRTLLRADEVLVFDGKTLIARHTRARSRGGQVLDLDHYLEVLSRKPGALPGAMALSQARAAKVFTPAHEAFWTAARAAHGDTGGTRALIEVLLLHRHLPTEAVIAGIRAALAVRAASPELVAVEARRAATGQTGGDQIGGQLIALPARATTPGGAASDQTCEEIPGETSDEIPGEASPDMQARFADMPGERPLPSMAHYDELLTRRSARAATRGTPETDASTS
jgi:hypothetical protein